MSKIKPKYTLNTRGFIFQFCHGYTLRHLSTGYRTIQPEQERQRTSMQRLQRSHRETGGPAQAALFWRKVGPSKQKAHWRKLAPCRGCSLAELEQSLIGVTPGLPFRAYVSPRQDERACTSRESRAPPFSGHLMEYTIILAQLHER
ncbi:Protein Aster-B [Manis javanica]|nr:Protein Aster-B [Manis javanica]